MNNHESDIVVVGSGAAGLTAAIVASDQGCAVTLLEKSPKIGGSTSVSNGEIWIPNNHHMKEVGRKDTKESALQYLSNLSSDLADQSLLQAFVETAPKALEYLEGKASLRVESRNFPDYHAEFEGGNYGRTLGTGMFDANTLGAWSEKVRKGSYPPVTVREVTEWTGTGAFARFDKIRFDVIQDRNRGNFRSRGSALVCMLLKGCLDRGVSIHLETKATRIVQDESGRVVGTEAEKGGEKATFLARKAVILATGGFDWNSEYRRKFLMFHWAAPMSPPCVAGDGLRMGLEVGADVANMAHAFWAPCVSIPGEQFEDAPLCRLLVHERMQPGSMMVNRDGKRFVNEAVNYHDFVRALHAFDSAKASYPNIESWLIFDEKFRGRYIVLGIWPTRLAPDWITSAYTARELATKVGINPTTLEETIGRFNKYARVGIDEEFQRGDRPYDLQYADRENRPNPSLGPLETPPFYAVRVMPGIIGTAGGLRVNDKSQVISRAGNIILGLYACGNVAGFPFAPSYPASGSGIGNAITFGFIAGMLASQETTVHGRPLRSE